MYSDRYDVQDYERFIGADREDSFDVDDIEWEEAKEEIAAEREEQDDE